MEAYLKQTIFNINFGENIIGHLKKAGGRARISKTLAFNIYLPSILDPIEHVF